MARALFGEGTEQAASWAEKVLVRLGMGHIGFVLAQLKRLKPQNADTAEEIRKLAGYLENHRDKIHYISDLEEGYPIKVNLFYPVRHRGWVFCVMRR